MQEEIITFSNAAMVNQELFFVEAQNGLPSKMNPDNGVVSYCNVFRNFILDASDMIDYIQNLGNKVYALKRGGDSLIIFDLTEFQCRYIPLQCDYSAWGNFVAFEQYGSDFYIFPRYGNKIYVLNTIKNEISEIEDYFDGVTELQCACRAGNEVWMLPCKVGVIGCYDLADRKMMIYKLGKKIEDCVDAVLVDESVYILNHFGIICRWNTHDMELSEIKTLEKEPPKENMVRRILHAGNKLIILPALAEEIKILDLLTSKVEVYHDYPEDFLYYNMEYMAEWSKYDGICQDDNYYYCAMRRDNYLLKISKQDGTLLWIKPNLPSKEERMKIQIPLGTEKMKFAFASGEMVVLENEVGIGRFVEEIPKQKHIAEKRNAGEIIFGKVRL